MVFDTVAHSALFSSGTWRTRYTGGGEESADQRQLPRTRAYTQAAIADNKWARCGWSGSDEQEEQIKEETGATIRCFPFDQPAGPHKDLMSGDAADEVCLFAKSY